ITPPATVPAAPIQAGAALAAPITPIAAADRPSEPADIAGWLASLSQTELEQEGPAGAETESDMPGWLQGAGPEQSAESADDALAWLSARADAPGAAPAEAAADAPTTMPEWLRSMRDLEPAAEALPEDEALAES